jgi:hypothetical protein
MTKLRVLVLSFPDFTDISITQKSSKRSTFTLNICADVKRISEDYVRALEDLENAHIFEPNNVFSLNICGDVNRDYVGALEDLEKAHVLEPTNAFHFDDS